VTRGDGTTAAGRDLEDIAPPLSAQAAEHDEPGEEADPYTLGRGENRGAPHAERATVQTSESDQTVRPTGGER
jgi:hypothetical protein